jgi:hypothetical protein
MLDDLRSLALRALETKRGDSFLLIRVQKRILRRVHRLLGSPLAPSTDATPPAPPPPAREPAPVMVYVEGDRNIRERLKIEDTLRARNISYRLLDVSGDPSTKTFVVQAAKCEEDDLPVVFVGGDVVGPYNELVQWDVTGRLVQQVFGA